VGPDAIYPEISSFDNLSFLSHDLPNATLFPMSYNGKYELQTRPRLGISEMKGAIMPKSLLLLALGLCCGCAANAAPALKVTSDFKNNTAMAKVHAYTGEGENQSIPITISQVPSSAKSLAISIVDLHPVAHHWVHWLVVDIPAQTRTIAAGASGTAQMPGQELQNSFGEVGYGGPLPPIGSGEHQYQVTIYALSVPTLGLSQKASLADFQSALAGKILAQGTITGLYKR
jgi:Raf kinase inhibitor-like YbhB/YbcL family protein